MWVFYVLFSFDFFVACVYAKKSYPTVDLQAFLLKMVASGIFVLSGALAYVNSEKEIYAKLIMSALVLGMAGDALLSLDPFYKNSKKPKKWSFVTTVVGAGLFLAGHIVYIIAFVKEVKIRDAFRLPVFLVLWFIGIGIGICATLALKLKHGKLTVPMLIYMVGLCAMSAVSINLALFGCGDNLVLRLALIIAPILFMISDSTLGLKFADKERFSTAKMRYLTLLTYYSAQMLFSLTILMIN